MNSNSTTGRRLGTLFLAHLLFGLMTPYILLQSLATAKGFVATASVNEFQVRLAVLLLFVSGALTVAIAVTAWPVFRFQAGTLGMWVIALAIANFALQCTEIAGYMAMFTVSREYLTAAATNLTLYDALSFTVRHVWKWQHYSHLLVMVSWMFLVFAALWRTASVPKVLAGLAMLTALMQITGISLPQFIPYPAPPTLIMGLPLAFAYAALAIWLMVKGLGTPRRIEDSR
jgi:uncharacterized protein DUF4386